MRDQPDNDDHACDDQADSSGSSSSDHNDLPRAVVRQGAIVEMDKAGGDYVATSVASNAGFALGIDPL